METKKELISVTDLTTYLYCPRSLYLKKIKKIFLPPTREMIAGRLKHLILEAFSKKEDNLIKNIDKDYEKIELAIIYDDFIRKLADEIFYQNRNLIEGFRIKPEEEIKKFLKDFSHDLKLRIESIKDQLKKGFFKEELLKNLDKFYISELKVESDNIGLKGRIDRVEISRSNNKIIPYEIKNRIEKIYFSDELQLTAYAMLLEDLYKVKIEKGFIESGTKKHELLISEEDKQSVFKLIEEIRAMRANLIPPILSNFNKCKNCSLNEICPNV